MLMPDLRSRLKFGLVLYTLFSFCCYKFCQIASHVGDKYYGSRRMVLLLKLLLLFAFSDQLGKMITCTCNMKGKIVICNSHIVDKFPLGQFLHPVHGMAANCFSIGALLLLDGCLLYDTTLNPLFLLLISAISLLLMYRDCTIEEMGVFSFHLYFVGRLGLLVGIVPLYLGQPHL